jgi:hypothetical protein
MPCHHVMPLNPKETQPPQKTGGGKYANGGTQPYAFFVDRYFLFHCIIIEREQLCRYRHHATAWPTETLPSRVRNVSLHRAQTRSGIPPRPCSMRAEVKQHRHVAKQLSCMYTEIRNTRSHTSVRMWLLVTRTTVPITIPAVAPAHAGIVTPLNTSH